MSERIGVSMTYKGGFEGSIDNGRVEITGLFPSEVDAIEGMVNGFQRIGVKDGRLEVFSVHKSLPDPFGDEEMIPFWRRATPGGENLQYELFELEPLDSFSSSITIQHLCGYYRTPEEYKRQAEILESYGFVCLRSRRDTSGKYWELWYLPFLGAACGELLNTIGVARELEKRRVQDLVQVERAKTQAAVSFLCQTVSFGTLNVTVQRAAMPVPD